MTTNTSATATKTESRLTVLVAVPQHNHYNYKQQQDFVLLYQEKTSNNKNNCSTMENDIIMQKRLTLKASFE